MGQAVISGVSVPVLSVSYKYFPSTCSFSRSEGQKLQRDKSVNVALSRPIRPGNFPAREVGRGA
jgi:hypothetical protein